MDPCSACGPIMMTMLVASFGLLPAAFSRGIGSDSQRPFAIVIVGGLVAALILGVYLLPTLYVWVAGERDVLPEVEGEAATIGVCPLIGGLIPSYSTIAINPKSMCNC